MTKAKRIHLTFLVTVLFSPMAANAIPISWTLQDVALSDGGTAIGSYVFDVDTNTYSDISITTTAGSSMPGDTYEFLRPLSGTLDSGFSAVDLIEADLTGNDAFSLVLVASMTNAGGIIDLEINFAAPFYTVEALCGDPDCDFGVSPFRTAVSGYVVGSPASVPEPGTLALLGIGLLGMGASRRKGTA